jgi:hypothetical protein
LAVAEGEVALGLELQAVRAVVGLMLMPAGQEQQVKDLLAALELVRQIMEPEAVVVQEQLVATVLPPLLGLAV